MLGGIIRHDGISVPDEWIYNFTDAAKGTSFRAKSVVKTYAAGAMVFIAPAECVRAIEPGSLLLCDARLNLFGSAGTGLRRGRGTDAVASAYNGLSNDASAQVVDGDFILALWRDESCHLHLASSPLCTRALFYVAQEGFFAFCSALRPLLTLPIVSRELDDGTISRMLSFDGSGPPDTTFYRAVKRLPAAHRLDLERDQISVRPPPEPVPVSLLPAMVKTEDAAATARSLLVKAVQCRIGTGEIIAVHLSGGLDSAAIACIAARHLRQQGRRLLALCSVLPIGHAGPEKDERAFIEAVLAQEDNIDPVWLEMPSDSNPFSALPRWFECLGEPHYSTVTHVEERLGEVARAHGADVALSGFGGDFFLSARVMPAPAALLVSGRWAEAGAEIWRLGIHGDVPWLRLLREQVWHPLKKHYRPLPPDFEAGCATTALLDRVEGQESRRPRTTVPGMARATAHETMRFILEPGHLERVLPATRQVFLEQFGQDLRFPMLDPHLVAFVLGLPTSELNRDGQSRSLMRRAMSGILPEAVRLRPDKGAAFDPALAAHCALARPALREWAEACSPRSWDYVDRERFLAALDAVEPTGRAGWRKDMFSVLLSGGQMAHFVDWHARGGAKSWR
jgi:asparagine synthase (glutamine-hydrolysing)